MKTYLNGTGETIVVTYQAGGNEKVVSVPPGGRLSFDESEANGAEIEQQLIDGGATPADG